jgi:hypothetical protein
MHVRGQGLLSRLRIMPVDLKFTDAFLKFKRIGKFPFDQLNMTRGELECQIMHDRNGVPHETHLHKTILEKAD